MEKHIGKQSLLPVPTPSVPTVVTRSAEVLAPTTICTSSVRRTWQSPAEAPGGSAEEMKSLRTALSAREQDRALFASLNESHACHQVFGFPLSALRRSLKSRCITRGKRLFRIPAVRRRAQRFRKRRSTASRPSSERATHADDPPRPPVTVPVDKYNVWLSRPDSCRAASTAADAMLPFASLVSMVAVRCHDASYT